MKIIIPMSGQGTRFVRASHTDPKPLIKVHGKPIVEHVVNLFPGEDDFVFICRKEHLETTDMRSILLSLKPKASIVEIEGSKLGPVYAVAQAFDHISDAEPVIVNYCDFFMDWDYADFKKTVGESGCDGSVVAYKGFHPHLLHEKNVYASMRVDGHNMMQEIREKYSFTPEKIHSPQSAGTYYFKRGEYVKKYFNELMEKEISFGGEYYVSLVYNLLRQDGLRVFVYDKVPHFLQWGTPEDLKEYQYWSEIFETYE